MENRISYSVDEMLQSVEHVLDRLNVLRYDGQYREVLGDAVIDKLNTWDYQIRKRRKDPFTVVVIGDFKRGKSTFINALLGEEVVTTDVTTETVTFNRISHGAHSNEAILSGNRRMRLSDAELKKEELEKIIEQAGEPIYYIELKRPIDILKDIAIVDTPGTGDSMFDFAPQVEKYLLQADAVIYLYSVKYPLSQTEQLFLKAAVLPQKYTKLFLIGNYTDTVRTKEEYERVRRAVTERVHKILPETEVLTLSALDELCKRLGEERPCKKLEAVLEGQFDEFREMLNNLIKSKKDIILVDRMQRLTSGMLKELGEELQALEQGLVLSEEEAQKYVEVIKDKKQESLKKQTEILRQVDDTVATMQGEATGWMAEFLGRIKNEASTLTNISSEVLLKYYSFYCIDMMQIAMNTCVEWHRERLFDELEGISANLARELLQDFKRTKGYSFRFNLDNKVWTTGDNVGLAVSMAGSLGVLTTIASVVADGISGAIRQREVEKKKPDIMKQIVEQMSGLELSVMSTIKEIYTNMGESAKKHILDYYEEELKHAEHLLSQSVAIAHSEEEQKEKIRKCVSEARKILQDVDRVANSLVQ